MSKAIPDYPLDIFTTEAVISAREVDDALREFAPVVRLADGTVMLGRHEHVAAGLLDWKAFSSASRPWHDPTSPRPEILLTDDPPRHTQVRKVIADALSPRALERVKDIFELRAQELLARLRAREGESVDAVSEVSQAYVFRVLPDILGLPDVALDDSDSSARWILGLAQLYKREFEDARVHFEKAVEHNPNFTEARIFYGFFLTAIGQPDAPIMPHRLPRPKRASLHGESPCPTRATCYSPSRGERAASRRKSFFRARRSTTMWWT